MHARIFRYLSEHDKLNLRITCKAAIEFARNNEKTPYPSKAAFVIGLSGQFDGPDWCFEKGWEESWLLYRTTCDSKSDQPAMLYKLHDLFSGEFDRKVGKFAKGEDLKKTGRQYAPSMHSWKVNEVWVLAQIHRGRPFTILSDLSGRNKIRRTGLDYSAFTKEIIFAVHSGYRPDLTADKQLSLLPQTDKEQKTITIQSIKAKDKQINDFYNLLAAYRDKHTSISANTRAAASRVSVTLKRIRVEDVEECQAESPDRKRRRTSSDLRPVQHTANQTLFFQHPESLKRSREEDNSDCSQVEIPDRKRQRRF